MKSCKTMKMSYQSLPSGYDLYKILDMANDKQEFRRISVCSIFAVAFMVALGAYLVPLNAIFMLEVSRIIFCAAAMIIGLIVYVFMHEWVHGAAIRLITGENAEFGFVKKAGMAYAKSRFFFGKKAYIVIALAPVVLWGVILAILLRDVSPHYFWYLYAIQIFNISGAAGDFYVAWLVGRMPKQILIYDEGTSMKFFAPTDFE